MKKQTTIVLAAAALNAAAAGSAMAQSSVTLNGWLNLGVIKTTGSDTKLGTVSRSNIAFSGKEDLGDGFAATFKLSTRFEMDTGTTEAGDRPFWQGESTVGLKGKFGAVRLGRALSPIGAQDGTFDAWQVFDRVASPAWWFFIPDFVPDPLSGQANNGHDYGRVANGIFYDSPDLSGFHFHLSTAASENASDRARHYGASFNYDKDGLSLMLGAEQNSQRDRAYFVGAAYKIGPVNTMLGYSHVKLDPAGSIYGAEWTNWAAASDPKTKRTSVVLTSTIDVGTNSILLGVGRDFQGSTNAFNFIGSNFTKVGTNFSGASNFFGAGYLYNLSKRTSLFFDASYVKWQNEDDNGRTHATGYAVGVNHGF